MDLFDYENEKEGEFPLSLLILGIKYEYMD